MKRYRDPEHRRFVKRLRQNMTEAERRLWYHLRAHRFFGQSFRRQAPLGPYVADFLHPKTRLVIEIDGETHRPTGDALRDQALARMGYRTLRFANADVLDDLDAVLARIRAELVP